MVTISLKKEQLLFLFFSSFYVFSFANDENGLQYKNIIFEASQISQSNFGVITNNYWSNRDLSLTPQNVIGLLDISLRASAQFNYLDFYLARENIHTYVGSANALTIAANDSKYATPGSFPVFGSYKFFDYNAIGISIPKLINSNTIDWTIAPEVLSLHDFQNAQGNAILNFSNINSSLIGSLSRQGVNSYGFLVDENPTLLSYGYSVNSSLTVHQPLYDINLKANNIFSGFYPSNYFFSNMIINANEVGNKFAFSAVPTITGNYGQTSSQLKLPIITESNIVSKSNPELGFGFKGIDSNYYTFIKSQYSYKDYISSLEINSLNNATIFFTINNLLLRNLNFSFATAFAEQSKPNLYFSRVIYSY